MELAVQSSKPQLIFLVKYLLYTFKSCFSKLPFTETKPYKSCKAKSTNCMLLITSITKTDLLLF